VGDFDTDMKASLGQATFDRARAEGIVGLDLGWRTIALKGEFFDSLEAHSISDALERIDVPTFAVAGSEDFSAQYAESLPGQEPRAPRLGSCLGLTTSSAFSGRTRLRPRRSSPAQPIGSSKFFDGGTPNILSSAMVGMRPDPTAS
jgi:hypothetical protein